MLSRALQALGDWFRGIWRPRAPRNDGVSPSDDIPAPVDDSPPLDRLPDPTRDTSAALSRRKPEAPSASPPPERDPSGPRFPADNDQVAESPVEHKKEQDADDAQEERDVPARTGPDFPADNDQDAESSFENKKGGHPGDVDVADPQEGRDVPARTPKVRTQKEVQLRPASAEPPPDPGLPDAAPAGSEPGRDPVSPPRGIPGRRDRSTSAAAPPPTEKVARNPAPELICRKPPGSSHWEVALLVKGNEVVTVTQNGDELANVKGDNGEWQLESFAGSLSVAVKDGRSMAVPLVDESPLVFKFQRNWTGIGRNVRRMTKGHFLLIAPSGWKRTGQATVAPEACSDSGFLAHFFFSDGNETEEDLCGFEEHELAPSGSGFELTGNRVFDDSEEGPLFGGDPPRMTAAQGVAWARVGEERKNGWRGQNFKPAEQTLADVLNGRQGRFFLRVYDRERRLLDSDQFRYLSALQEIQVNGAAYSPETLFLPPPSGHQPTRVAFTAIEGATIRPILRTEAGPVAGVKRVENTLVAQPTPDADDISCALETDGGWIDIALTLPRIWWRIRWNTAEVDDAWRGKPLVLSRQRFREWADAGVTLELRLPDRVQSVRAGFDEESGPAYPNRKNRKDHVRLPLDHFVDFEQVADRLEREARFNVRFKGPDQENQELLCLIRIPADPVPEIVSFRCEPASLEPRENARLSWSTRNTADAVVIVEPDIGEVEPTGDISVAPEDTTTYTLKLTAPGMANVTSQVTARVRPQPDAVRKPVARVRRRGGGWRIAKGFSHRELRAAGLTLATARQRFIPTDSRRRSSHHANIQSLRSPADG